MKTTVGLCSRCTAQNKMPGQTSRYCRHELSHHNMRHRIWMAARNDAAFFAWRVAIPRQRLKVQEDVLHPVALAIRLPIMLPRHLAVAFRRDHRFNASPAAVRQDLVGVISPIRQQCSGIHSFDQDVSMVAIRCGTCCSNRSKPQTMRIHGQMQFRVEPPLVRSIA